MGCRIVYREERAMQKLENARSSGLRSRKLDKAEKSPSSRRNCPGSQPAHPSLAMLRPIPAPSRSPTMDRITRKVPTCPSPLAFNQPCDAHCPEPRSDKASITSRSYCNVLSSIETRKKDRQSGTSSAASNASSTYMGAGKPLKDGGGMDRHRTGSRRQRRLPR